MNKEKDEKPAKVEAAKKAPLKWGAELMTKKIGKGILAKDVPHPFLAAADIMLGWSEQAHHFGEDSFELTEEDFRKGVQSCADFPAVPLHQAAIPPVSKTKLSKTKKAR